VGCVLGRSCALSTLSAHLSVRLVSLQGSCEGAGGKGTRLKARQGSLGPHPQGPSAGVPAVGPQCQQSRGSGGARSGEQGEERGQAESRLGSLGPQHQAPSGSAPGARQGPTPVLQLGRAFIPSLIDCAARLCPEDQLLREGRGTGERCTRIGDCSRPEIIPGNSEPQGRSLENTGCGSDMKARGGGRGQQERWGGAAGGMGEEMRGGGGQQEGWCSFCRGLRELALQVTGAPKSMHPQIQKQDQDQSLKQKHNWRQQQHTCRQQHQVVPARQSQTCAASSAPRGHRVCRWESWAQPKVRGNTLL